MRRRASKPATPRLAGVDIVHVPYRGAVFTDVIGGRVTMTLQNVGTILPVVREGKLRGLAVTSLKRSASGLCNNRIRPYTVRITDQNSIADARAVVHVPLSIARSFCSA